MTEVELYADLSLSIDGLRDEVKKSREPRRPPQPIERALSNAGNFPSSGVMALNMGGPEQGRVWQVRSIAVGGATPITTEAGRADVLVAMTAAQVLANITTAGSQPGAGGVYLATGFVAGSLNSWRDQATTLPNVAFYGLGDLAVHASEQLWIVFSSGTNTDLLIANIRVDDYETAAYTLTRDA